MDSNITFFSNGGVHKEFAVDEHYVGLACNRPTPSFCVVVDCYEGHMVLVCGGDEEHSKPIWLVTALSSPNFVPTSLNFRWIEVEYNHPSTKDHNVLRTYLGWDTKKGFKWTINSTYKPIWIHRFHTLCLEVTQGLQVGDNECPPKTYRFC